MILCETMALDEDRPDKVVGVVNGSGIRTGLERRAAITLFLEAVDFFRMLATRNEIALFSFTLEEPQENMGRMQFGDM
jgi:hypothetical protein